MTAPKACAPCLLLIDERGVLTLEIMDHKARALSYLVEPAAEMLDDWAVSLRRCDGEDGPYRVARTCRGRWKCSCADTRFGRPKRELRSCKHRYALQKLWLLIRRLTRADRHEDEETPR